MAAEVTEVTCPADNMFSLISTYFTFADGADNAFYAWVNMLGVDPDPTPGGTGIEVTVSMSDSATVVAAAVATAIDANINFGCTSAGAVATITNAAEGGATDAADGDMGVTINVTVQGSAGGGGSTSTPPSALELFSSSIIQGN